MSAKLLRDGDTVAQRGIYTQEISQGFCTYLKSLRGSFFFFLWRRESVLNTKHKERVFCWDKSIMAVNPQLYENGTPVPFVNEVFLLRRESVEFLVDKLPGAPGGKLSGKGTIYMSTFRIVFVLSRSVGDIFAFDIPLLFIHEESFNQPIFFCNNLSGKVYPVIPEGANRALYTAHTFKIMFVEGGVGTFIPLFMNLIKSVRAAEREALATQPSAPPADPLPTVQAPVDELIQHAYIDPHDPTKLYLQQPSESQPTLRRRNYSTRTAEEGQM